MVYLSADPDSAQPGSLQDKALALAAHVEELCASAVCVIRSGNFGPLEDLEIRKSIILQELVRMLKTPALSPSSEFIVNIIVRVSFALRTELDAVAAAAGLIHTELSLLRARERDLSRLRTSYGRNHSFADGAARMMSATMIARG